MVKSPSFCEVSKVVLSGEVLMMRFSLFVGVFVALTSECVVSELATSELAVLVTSELGFSETVSVEATSELATGVSALWQFRSKR